jgi:hypothetical protein
MKTKKVKDVEFEEVVKEETTEVVETEVTEEVESTETEETVETTEVENAEEVEAQNESEEPETNEAQNESDEIPDPTKCVKGTLVNCTRLNVRKDPKGDASVVKVINTTTPVMVDLDKSTEDFYYVYSIEGFEGYCMKNFMNVE